MSLDFQDSGDRVTYTTDIGLANQEFTMAAYLQIDAVNSVYRAICDFSDSDDDYTTNIFFQFDSAGTNRLLVGYADAVGGDYHDANWISGFAAGSRHCVFGTYDGTDLALYADEDTSPKASTTESDGPNIVGPTLTTIGNGRTGGSPMDGHIEWIAYWDRFLNDRERLAIAQGWNPFHCFPQNLKFFVDFNSGQALDVINREDGTLTDAPATARGFPRIDPCSNRKGSYVPRARYRRRRECVGDSIYAF